MRHFFQESSVLWKFGLWNSFCLGDRRQLFSRRLLLMPFVSANSVTFGVQVSFCPPELLQIVFGCFWQKQSVSLCTRPCLPTCASSINFFHTACCRRFTLVFQARKRDCSPYPEEKKAGQHERSLKQKACCDRFEKGGS